MLEHLPALTLLALPLIASYKRMADGCWSGGTYVSWGVENKESPVRLCNPHSPSSRNFELKTLDGTANPYLALAGVIGAGLSGIVESKELTMQDCSGGVTAALLGEEGRANLGIKDRFPLNWEDACSKFEASAIVDSIFGNEFKRKFLSIQKAWIPCLFNCLRVIMTCRFLGMELSIDKRTQSGRSTAAPYRELLDILVDTNQSIGQEASSSSIHPFQTYTQRNNGGDIMMTGYKYNASSEKVDEELFFTC